MSRLTCKTIAVHTRKTGVADTTDYLLRDYQGSVVAITDASGNVKGHMDYDAFGARRPILGISKLDQIISSFPRGYTGHEHLDNVGLIHMNGRVYDANLGRFLSADPIVQAPNNLQSLNRYSYVLNNPMSYTDPSGHSWKRIKRRIRKTVGQLFKAAFKVVARSGYIRREFREHKNAGRILQFAAAIADAYGCSGVCSASASAYLTEISGGSAEDIGKAGIDSYASYALASDSSGLSGGINGYLQTGDSEGFFRGALASQINFSSLDLFQTSQIANFVLNRVSDYARGYVIDGADGGVKSLRAGLGNDAIGHVIGLTTSYIENDGFKGPKFRGGVYYYDSGDTIISFGAKALTVGNVVSGPSSLYSNNLLGRNAGLDRHERAHALDQRALGSYYLPIHILSQWGNALLKTPAFLEYQPFISPGYGQYLEYE